MTFNFLTTDADNIRRTIIALSKLSIVLVQVLVGMVVIRWLMTYEQQHRESMNRYHEWYDQVVSDPHPARQDLLKIGKLHGRKSPIFHQSVQAKLESYDHTANTIEATMSPVQLYEVGNPLWTTGLSVNAIRGFLMIDKLTTQENVNPHDYLEAYVADVRSGTSVSEAYDKQETGIKTNKERK